MIGSEDHHQTPLGKRRPHNRLTLSFIPYIAHTILKELFLAALRQKPTSTVVFRRVAVKASNALRA